MLVKGEIMRSDLSAYPRSCSEVAFFRFLDALPALHTTEGLVDAAIAVSTHALDDVDPEWVREDIAALADRVQRRVRNPTKSSLLAHLHDVLFEEERFAGNNQHPRFALGSYLPAVLATHSGLPILLSLLYKAVAEQVGLQVEGVNAPSHFLVRVTTDEGPAIVDPFYGGALLSREEAFQRLEHAAGRPLPRDDRLLSTASHSQWIHRIIANLIAVFAADNRLDDLAAMLELRQVLEDTLL